MDYPEGCFSTDYTFIGEGNQRKNIEPLQMKATIMYLFNIIYVAQTVCLYMNFFLGCVN